MNVALLVLWAAVGWCGTPWRRWPPPPDPDPNPWLWRVVGVVGGLIGGWAFSAVWPGQGGDGALYAAATSVGALVGSAIVQDIVGMARGGRAARA